MKRFTLSIVLLLASFQIALGITPVFTCGFECGVAGPHWTSLNNASFSTTTFNNGLRAARCNASPGFSNLTSPTLSSFTRLVGRLYIHFATLPSANTALIVVDGSSVGPNVTFNQSNSKLYAAVGTSLGATGIAVTTGQWYRVDFDFNINTSGNDLCDIQVGGVATGQATATGLNAAQTQFFLGASSSVTHDIFFDDIILSNTGADYPIGAGLVLSIVPAADGTHTFTSTHAILGTTGAPTTGGNITSSTTTAFNWANARPIGGGATDATRLINQATAASTEYCELAIEQTTQTVAPQAVEILGVYQHATSSACNSQFKVNDNGTENVVFNDTGHTNAVDAYFTKQYATMPADSAAWTLARFKALKLRFGYSSDATPDVYNRGWMIEADFPISAAVTAPKRLTTLGVGK